MSSEQQYIKLYEENRGLIASHAPAPLNAAREQAFADFRRMGLPTRKAERYKYTDMQEVFAPDYGLNLSRLSVPLDERKAFACSVPNLSARLFCVVNDQPHSSPVTLAGGAFVSSLAFVAKERPQLLEEHYGKLALTRKDALNALNTMLAQDGVVVYVPKGVALERPVQVVNLLRSDVPLMANRRVLVVLEQGAEAKLLFCDHTADNVAFLTTQVSEVSVGAGAKLELYEVEETHALSHRIANMYVQAGAGASVTLASVTLHNGLSRNRTDVSLSGEGAEARLLGCVVAGKSQHVDNNTLVDHKAQGCLSDELYKYVLDGKAVGAFAGRVLVRQGAQRSVSKESCAGLCATSEARMLSQPMLEIYADDVQCAHGSTVGQLNEQALFYMRQRGVDEDEARLLLSYAFVGQVIDSIRLAPLAERLRLLTERRLRGELSKCEGCAICR